MDYLAESHEVIPFSYDWRQPIENEARRLGTEVEAALVAREQSGQPVRLLAHSMGGLLARALQIECGPIWDRMMERQGARLLMLGTPNAGSWAPMQVLSGDDSMTLPLLAIGGRGVISVVGNLVPADMKQLCDAFDAGDLAGAQALHRRLFGLCRDLLGLASNPIPIKTALAMLGRDTGEVRLPLVPLEPALAHKLRGVLAAYGLRIAHALPV